MQKIQDRGSFRECCFYFLVIYCLQSIKRMLREDDEQYNNDRELKKSHTLITSKKREKLIQLVIQEGLTIYRAAKRLKICHPTAKFIVKNYRNAHGLPKQTEINLNNKAKGAQSLPQSSEIQKQPKAMSPTHSPVDPMAERLGNGLEQSTLLANFWAFYGNGCYFQHFYYNS